MKDLVLSLFRNAHTWFVSPVRVALLYVIDFNFSFCWQSTGNLQNHRLCQTNRPAVLARQNRKLLKISKHCPYLSLQKRINKTKMMKGQPDVTVSVCFNASSYSTCSADTSCINRGGSGPKRRTGREVRLSGGETVDTSCQCLALFR